jgi:hypothetical protein
MRNSLGLFALAGLLLASGGASAESLLDAPIAYSATRSVTVDGRAYSGIVHHVAGKERQEQDLLGMRAVFILDGGATKGWLVVPALKSFVAFPFPPVMAMLASPILKKTALGNEPVNGIATTKYRIHAVARDGTIADGIAWFDRRGVLMKLTGVVIAPQGHRTLIALEVSQVAEAPQDAGLFVPPRNYTQLPAEALAPLLGAPAGAPSGAPPG